MNDVNESILTSIKKLLGIAEDYEHFDPDIIIHINTYLTRLCQIGVGVQGFIVTNKTQTWKDFLIDESRFQQAKTYVYMRVRLIFDPPTVGSAVEAFKENIKELEWLLFVDVDNNGFENDTYS